MLLPSPLIETLEAEANRRGVSVSDVIVDRLSGTGQASPVAPSEDVPHRCRFKARGASGLLRCDCGRLK